MLPADLVADFVFSGRGSSALFAILKSLKVAEKKILIPVNICEIIYPVILSAGFSPVFYDVDEVNGNGRLENIKAKYSGTEMVLLATHNFGAPVDIKAISQWSKENNIFLIEDVCNALGAKYEGKMLGTWGDAAIFSFGYAKIIEYGIGGAALLKSEKIKNDVRHIINSFEYYANIHKQKDVEFQAKLRELRKDKKNFVHEIYIPLYQEYSDYLFYKITHKQEVEINGLFNSLDENLNNRKQNAQRYRNGIKSDKVRHINSIDGQIYWRYNLLVESGYRDALVADLRKNNILVSTWYPPIIQLFEKKFKMDDYRGGFSFSEKIVNLFVDNRVSQSDITKTIDIINNFK